MSNIATTGITAPSNADNEEPKPLITIRPSSGWSALNIKQLWLFRDLLFTLAGRDIKLRYRQTALGAIWVVLQPLLGAGILSFVFNKVAEVPTGTLPPFLASYIGMVAFTAFSSTLLKASGSLVGSAQLISKIFFPRLLLPLSTLFSTLIDFGVAFVVLLLLLGVNRVMPSASFFLFPVWLLLLLMLALGVGMFTASLAVSYRDVQYILPVIVNLLTFASPVAYSASFVISKLPESMQPYYFVLNPIASLIEAFRWSVTGRGEVPWGYVIYSSVLAVAVFFAGALIFKRMERRFADVI